MHLVFYSGSEKNREKGFSGIESHRGGDGWMHPETDIVPAMIPTTESTDNLERGGNFLLIQLLAKTTKQTLLLCLTTFPILSCLFA